MCVTAYVCSLLGEGGMAQMRKVQMQLSDFSLKEKKCCLSMKVMQLEAEL